MKHGMPAATLLLTLSLVATVGFMPTGSHAEQTADVPPAKTSTESNAAPTIRWVEFDTMVSPATANRILAAIDAAEEAGDELVFIRLDTPGGLVDTTHILIQRILNSRVPVVVWVGPSGARAASAGFFILTAADVAAMAPGTRTGASSTVTPQAENRDDDPMLRKSNEDNAALMRSIAERRNRNKEAADQAIFEAKAFEESVALRDGLIDLVAGSREEVLEYLDGRTITMFDGRQVVLRTANAQFVETDLGPYHAFLEVLGTPWVAGLLLMGGMLGLYLEFAQPGVVLPGVTGAACLLLFALSSRLLPISAIGVLLIVLAIVMFILEIKVVSYGMLTVGGAICLTLGGWLLVDGPIPEMRIPFNALIPISLTITAAVVLALSIAIRAQRNRVTTGAEGLIGTEGRVTQLLNPEGKVLVHGEVWNAVTPSPPLAVSHRVRVTHVDDLMLTVMPAEVSAEDPHGESS